VPFSATHPHATSTAAAISEAELDGLRLLTLTEPFATMVRLGAKRVETRSWTTSSRGPVAIHAAKGFPPAMRALCHTEPFRSVLAAAGLDGPDDLPRGNVVAVVTLTDVLPADSRDPRLTGRLTPLEAAVGNYAPGRFAWLLDDLRALTTPVPAVGRLGLWRPPPPLLEVLRECLAAA